MRRGGKGPPKPTPKRPRVSLDDMYASGTTLARSLARTKGAELEATGHPLMAPPAAPQPGPAHTRFIDRGPGGCRNLACASVRFSITQGSGMRTCDECGAEQHRQTVSYEAEHRDFANDQGERASRQRCERTETQIVLLPPDLGGDVDHHFYELKNAGHGELALAITALRAELDSLLPGGLRPLLRAYKRALWLSKRALGGETHFVGGAVLLLMYAAEGPLTDAAYAAAVAHITRLGGACTAAALREEVAQLKKGL